MSTRGIIILLFFSFVLFVVSIYALMRVDPGVKPKPEGTIAVSQEPIGGSFKLQDTAGREVTESVLRGKITMVYFGYGHCPDTCPTTLNNMTLALNQFSTIELESLQAFFITLDPKRDSAEYLKKFISAFHSKIIPLLGSEKELEKVSLEYKVYSSKDDTKGDAQYLIDHSSLIYIMGKDGKYLMHFTSATPADEIYKELKKLLTEGL